VLDDASNEFDPNSPQFGEKYAPPFLPVSIRDWAGYEISRTYTDRYGVYNALVPSTYTASTPIPSGMTPSMLTACINAPLLANGAPDPYYNKQYSQFCYTLQYLPGTTTYLDTPVLPTGAFAGPGQATLDAELPDQTPVIKAVSNRFALGTPAGAPTVPAGSGPYLFGNSANVNDRTLTITSAGAAVAVPNPAYDQVAFGNVNNGDTGCVAVGGAIIDTCHKTVNRDYSFGASTGQVYIGATPLQIQSWTGDEIVAIVPANTPTGQLKVVRNLAGGKTRPTVAGVTVTLATSAGYTAATAPAIVDASVTAAGNIHNTIQSAVDAVPGGGIVLVKPGTYEELVIMDHPVRLQGAGAGSTVINAVKTPAEKMQAWRDRVVSMATTTPSYLLDFQNTELTALLPPDQSGELLGPILGGEGAAVTVFAQRITQRIGATTYVCPPGVARTSAAAFGLASDLTSKARIDGFALTGSDQAAGIEVNANACNIEVLNNRIYSNMGDFGSGVRLGHPGAIADLAIDPAHNDYARIANNHVLQNTSLNYDGGGAIAIGTGADGYQVKDNFIAGNFSFGHGGGVTHLGLSNGGTIERNTIVFNEVYNQDLAKEGGAIYIGGVLPATGAASSNSGDVVVANNQIQGNAAIGDGGGIAVYYAGTSRVGLFGNMIVNNVAGLAGGGIALQEARNVQIVHTTVSNNDSLGVAQLAFISPTESRPQVAGIVARTNGVATIRNSVVWQNRSFSYGPCPTPQDPLHPCSVNLDGTTPGTPTYGLRAALAGAGGPPINYYWDFGGAGSLNVAYSNATSFAGTTNAGNNATTAAPFTSTYFNGDRKQTITAPDIATAIPVPATFDEGGNFIRPMFGPLTLNRLDTGALYGDYHVTSNFAGGQTLMGAAGVFTNVTNAADLPAGVKSDADGDVRPNSGPTRGGDQFASGPPAFVPGIAIASASLAEGNAGVSQMPFVVTLSAPTTVAVSVNYATSNGTARDTGCNVLTQYQCGDYTTTTGTLTIPAGSTTGTIYVPINGDTMFETDETFTMTLSSPANGTISGGGTATGSIVNDDVRPTITVGNSSAAESALLVTFPLTLSNPSSQTVTVRYATASSSPVSAVGMNAVQCLLSATCDYVSGSNLLVTFLPGQTTASAVVVLKSDTIVEPAETFRVILSAPVNGTLVVGSGDTAVGTIIGG
jgi:large repetitive protein